MKKRFIKKSKYDNEAILFTSTVKNIEIKNHLTGDKLKTVFYLESKQFSETGRMCVIWGKQLFNTGDEVTCKGRLNEQGTFLCWSLYITKRCKESSA